MEKGNVLLTGGSGFIASHVLDALLQSSYHVVITVRTAEKGRAALAALPPNHQPLVSFATVDDVAREGAFDELLQQSVAEGRPFDYAIHTASPYQTTVQDPVRDFLDPAIRGTTGLLKSIHKLTQMSSSPATIKRVVLLSSSAAMLNPANHAAVYNESIWRPVTWAEAQMPQNAYEASKVFAERAAWAFVNGSDDLETAGETFDLPAGNVGRATSFDLAVVNCTYTFGPVQRWLTRLDHVNSSNRRIRDLLLGKWKKAVDSEANSVTGMPPTRPVFTWVDARDVARAIVKAMEIPSAGGRRFYVVGGHFSNGRMAGIVRSKLDGALDMKGMGEAQKLLVAERIPPPEDTPDDLPADVYQFDRRRAREVLGVISYYSLEESVLDTAVSLLDVEARERESGSRGRERRW